MELHGNNLVAGALSARNPKTFRARNPSTDQTLEPPFHEADHREIDAAAEAAEAAFSDYAQVSADERAAFLESIADEILKLGDALWQRANLETALPEARLTGERSRTINQIKLFANLIREGSWVQASIDRAQPSRQPLPKPDLRRMLVPIGPVAVFGASNFPLAFSVAGGDTISALAAGNPVIVKAHPAHPGTSELVAGAIARAAAAHGLPCGIFSMVHGVDHEISLSLVRHSIVRAVGFTGSLRAGRTLFDAANARPEPIPVYAEMGSTNPIFLLPDALQSHPQFAEGLLQSVTMGVGQFCTNPGLIFTEGSASALIERLVEMAKQSAPGTMLYRSLCDRYSEQSKSFQKINGVQLAGSASALPGRASTLIFRTDAKTFLANETLREEMFGPSTLVVECASTSELRNIAAVLPGQLTAAVFGSETSLNANTELVAILQRKAGRVLFNQFPTGVEVCASMQHGGPYPATTDSRSTSVGTAAILRFTRPLCFQNFPQASLPVELQDRNQRGIWRLVDQQWTREDC